MNCQKNDMAVVIREIVASKDSTGERVTVVKPGTVVRCVDTEPSTGYWYIEEPIPFAVTFSDGVSIRGQFVSIDDAWLRPLRDREGDDQTLTWAPVPSEVVA